MPPSIAFPTTTWRFIQHLQDSPEADLAALNGFITAYWKPVFCFLRARGYSLHQAEDLTQEFFLRLLERDWLHRADPQRGRFRTFLLTVLTRFLADQGPDRAPRQKAFETQVVSISSLISDQERTYEPPGDETPETIFMKQWAVGLLDKVREQLRQFYQTTGQPAWYELFATLHFAGQSEQRLSQQDLAERFGLTRDQGRYALEVVEKRFAHLLRREVGEQVGSDAEVGEEIRELLALLGR